jgi:hypothetical protein
MAGIATLASTVGAPITHIRKLDAANATTTGLLLSFKNDSGVACFLKLGIYIVTQPASGATLNADVETTNVIGDGIFNAQTLASTTVAWSDGNDVIADGSYLTLFNVTDDTPVVATSLVGYAVVELYPVCAVV